MKKKGKGEWVLADHRNVDELIRDFRICLDAYCEDKQLERMDFCEKRPQCGLINSEVDTYLNKIALRVAADGSKSFADLQYKFLNSIVFLKQYGFKQKMIESIWEGIWKRTYKYVDSELEFGFGIHNEKEICSYLDFAVLYMPWYVRAGSNILLWWTLFGYVDLFATWKVVDFSHLYLAIIAGLVGVVCYGKMKNKVHAFLLPLAQIAICFVCFGIKVLFLEGNQLLFFVEIYSEVLKLAFLYLLEIPFTLCWAEFYSVFKEYVDQKLKR